MKARKKALVLEELIYRGLRRLVFPLLVLFRDRMGR